MSDFKPIDVALAAGYPMLAAYMWQDPHLTYWGYFFGLFAAALSGCAIAGGLVGLNRAKVYMDSSERLIAHQKTMLQNFRDGKYGKIDWDNPQ